MRHGLVWGRPGLGVAALAILLAIGAGAADPADRLVSYPTRTMGTYGVVTLASADSSGDHGLAALGHAAFHHVDSLMSNWTETSEVARINRLAATETLTVERETASVLALALAVSDASGGAFDVTVEPLVRLWGFLGGERHVPSRADLDRTMPVIGVRHVAFDSSTRRLFLDREGVRIDLGGIAKGYGVDAATRALREAGVSSALVDISGNMRAWGAPPGRDHWLVGIRDPRDRVPYVARIAVREGALATSGTYEQFIAKDGREYGHILDPRTGMPASGLISVTVLAGTAAEADAWGTALFVMGLGGATDLLATRSDLSAVLMTPGDGGADTLWIPERARTDVRLVEDLALPLHVVYF